MRNRSNSINIAHFLLSQLQQTTTFQPLKSTCIFGNEVPAPPKPMLPMLPILSLPRIVPQAEARTPISWKNRSNPAEKTPVSTYSTSTISRIPVLLPVGFAWSCLSRGGCSTYGTNCVNEFI